MTESPDDQTSQSDGEGGEVSGGFLELSDAQVEEVIAAEIVAEAAEQFAVQMVVQQQSFRGPLPHPTLLQQYEDVIPGSAQRILDCSIDSIVHARRMEATAMDHETTLGRRGQFFALVLALVVLLGSMLLIADGKQIAGTLLATIDVVAHATVFIVGRRPSATDD